jgi:RimJ/RimL family protein N-acetyltransferase
VIDARDEGMSDLHRIRTERLELNAVTEDDIDVLYRLNSDRRVWAHFPSGVHTSRERTAAQVAAQAAAWERDGLGYWTARLLDGTFAGVGGCFVREQAAWNVYYRFKPETQGRGLASELVREACAAAATVRPDLPITAFLLEHNLASKAVAEKAGLQMVWRGPDTGNPDPAAIRLVYADRDLTPDVLSKLLAPL